MNILSKVQFGNAIHTIVDMFYFVSNICPAMHQQSIKLGAPIEANKAIYFSL